MLRTITTRKEHTYRASFIDAATMDTKNSGEPASDWKREINLETLLVIGVQYVCVLAINDGTEI